METMSENWVEEALKHAEAEVTFKDLDALESRRAQLQTKRDQALPIEQDLIDRLDEQIAAIDEEVTEELEFRRHLQEGAETLNGYKRIHLDIPLSWRLIRDQDSASLPALVVYPLHSSTMSFRTGDAMTGSQKEFWSFMSVVWAAIAVTIGAVSGGVSGSPALGITVGVLSYLAFHAIQLSRYYRRKWSSNGLFPPLPRALARHYDDILEDNRRAASYSRRYVFNRVAHFTGSIPAEVKAKIEEAKTTFGNNIYLVAQAEHWDNQDRTEITNVDPLVIGLKDSTTYLIDAFDLVPLEQAVAEEFTE